LRPKLSCIDLPVSEAFTRTNQSNEDNPTVYKPLSKYDLTKIFVSGQQNSIHLIRFSKHITIGNTRVRIGNIPNRVPFEPQTFYDLTIYTLVGKEVHTAAPSIG
jgi:hypothetical protein